jgi:hypothetical protein
MSSTAILFITDVVSDRICSHFTRLKENLSPGLNTFLVQHVKEDTVGTGVGDILVREKDIVRTLPRRNLQRMAFDRKINNGYFDLVFITACTHPLISSCEYVWFVEYDVDYTGNWLEFFKSYSSSDTDLVTTRIRNIDESRDYYHWQYTIVPEYIFDPAQGIDYRLNCLMPVSRLSRRYIDAYIDEMKYENWMGHFEIIVPSLAQYLGLSMEDLYKNESIGINQKTFGFRPVRSNAYFHEKPENFDLQNFLYHPVKVE